MLCMQNWEQLGNGILSLKFMQLQPVVYIRLSGSMYLPAVVIMMMAMVAMAMVAVAMVAMVASISVSRVMIRVMSSINNINCVFQLRKQQQKTSIGLINCCKHVLHLFTCLTN